MDKSDFTDLSVFTVVQIRRLAPSVSVPTGHIKWSGSGAVPKIGETVNVKVNRLGKGVVKAYYIRNWFLGVVVDLEVYPDWYISQEQHNGVPPVHVFGAELE